MKPKIAGDSAAQSVVSGLKEKGRLFFLYSPMFISPTGGRQGIFTVHLINWQAQTPAFIYHVAK